MEEANKETDIVCWWVAPTITTIMLHKVTWCYWIFFYETIVSRCFYFCCFDNFTLIYLCPDLQYMMKHWTITIHHPAVFRILSYFMDKPSYNTSYKLYLFKDRLQLANIIWSKHHLLWWRANALNTSFETLYGGQLRLSTHETKIIISTELVHTMSSLNGTFKDMVILTLTARIS